jgi:hypothetical protein
MELLNIEIDQESRQEAIYHVLLLPTSITIWPIVHPKELCMFCLLLKWLSVRGRGEGGYPQYQLPEGLLGSSFWGLSGSLDFAEQAN